MLLNALRPLLLVAVMASAVTATPPITIDAAQRTGVAPASFRIRITLEPDARNRSLCIQWVQLRPGNAEHTSCWSVQAEQEQRTTWKDLRDIPAGKYLVTAYALRSTGSPVADRLTLIVLGPGYDPDPPEE